MSTIAYNEEFFNQLYNDLKSYTSGIDNWVELDKFIQGVNESNTEAYNKRYSVSFKPKKIRLHHVLEITSIQDVWKNLQMLQYNCDDELTDGEKEDLAKIQDSLSWKMYELLMEESK